jgi:hypothetical protein
MDACRRSFGRSQPRTVAGVVATILIRMAADGGCSLLTYDVRR